MATKQLDRRADRAVELDAVRASDGRKRVLLDMAGVSAPSWGGMQEHVLTLSRHLIDAGWTPLILAHVQYADVYEERFRKHNIRVIRDSTLHNNDWQSLFRYIMALRRQLLKERISVYHLHSSLMGLEAASLLACSTASVASVVTYHCTPWNESRRRRLGMAAVHRIFNPMTITVSRAVAEMAWRNYRVPETSTAIILNGVDEIPSAADGSAIESAASRQDPDEVVVGVLARLEKVKGIDVLLEALARLEVSVPYRVVVAGEGPERPALESQLSRLGLMNKVSFIGFRSDVRQLMRQWNLVVVSSRSQEGLSLAAVEALAAQLPIVATRVGGLPEIVHDGENGWLVPPDNAGALAQALADAISNPAKRRRRGMAGRAFYLEELRADGMARKTIAIYRRAMRVGGETSFATA